MDWKSLTGLIVPALLTALVAIFTTLRRPLTSKEDAAAKLTDIALSLAEASDTKYRDQAQRLDRIEQELKSERQERQHCEERYDSLVSYLRDLGLNPPESP